MTKHHVVIARTLETVTIDGHYQQHAIVTAQVTADDIFKMCEYAMVMQFYLRVKRENGSTEFSKYI